VTARALTADQKRAVLERLLAAWLRAPELRLGQLIDNAVRAKTGCLPDLFDVEDEQLAELVEAFVAGAGR
jgi:hypothetical protein